jgi:CHAT domain-containing protein
LVGGRERLRASGEQRYLRRAQTTNPRHYWEKAPVTSGSSAIVKRSIDQTAHSWRRLSRATPPAALSERPAILHFAVHVVSPANQGPHSDEAALALSLKQDGVPELLTRESIAALRVPGALVVLSGCDSQQGTVLPGTGLAGLSRAWLLAGASAVLVTSWPTPDDSGTFFKVFCGHFQRAAGTVGQRAATALQQTQTEMKAGPGYRGEAAFWAAYTLISKG